MKKGKKRGSRECGGEEGGTLEKEWRIFSNRNAENDK